jgi:hypothetical protein
MRNAVVEGTDLVYDFTIEGLVRLRLSLELAVEQVM